MSDDDVSGLSQASFPFDPREIRPGDEPTEDNARLVWMICSLVRNRAVGLDRYIGVFGRSARTFKRDVKKLRTLGETYGFRLVMHKESVRLEDFGQPATPEKMSAAASDTLQAVVDALGDVIGRQLTGHVATIGANTDRFLRIAAPRLIAHTAVADTFATLRQAWVRHARVRFSYPARIGRGLTERTVEPYLVTYVAGRFYLVGFDCRARSGGWRQYALDRIAGPIAVAGTFKPRPLASAYRGEDAIGLFKTRGAVEVSVELSRTIAEAVIAREWQRSQRVVIEPAGRTTIAFEVHDIAEAVRWAFGFGTEARVVAPPEAVRLAHDMALAMAAATAPGASAGAARFA
jgi:predicted DNA-binding transcriptional regulator YafY